MTDDTTGRQPPSTNPEMASMRFDTDDEPAIRPDILDTFPYEHPGDVVHLKLHTDEFTSVCPWSGLPDFASLTVHYVPRERCIELKSFKYYLYSYRQVGIYYEHLTRRILNDLVEACDPVYMHLHGDFNIRGGIGCEAWAEYRAEDAGEFGLKEGAAGTFAGRGGAPQPGDG